VLYTDNNTIQCKHKGGNELMNVDFIHFFHKMIMAHL